MAYTYLDMYNLGSELLNKSGTPYFSEEQSDMFMNIAKNEELGNLIKVFQSTNVLSDKLSPITKSANFSNKTALNFTSDLPDYWHIVSIVAQINFTCKGVTTAEKIRVKPLSLKADNRIYQDPFNKPTKRRLWYKEINNTLTFLTTEASLSGVAEYISTPNKIDSYTTPSGVCEFSDDVCEDIVKKAVKLMEISVNDLQKASIQNQ